MRVHCRTNLDLATEEWPNELPAVPQVGDLIQSKVKHGIFQLQLQVTRVTWEYSEIFLCWIPSIELHMTDFQKHLPPRSGNAGTGSITAFYQWYAPLVGRPVGQFI